MSLKLYEDTAIQGIANAIRAKGGSGTYSVSQMAGAIANLPTGITPSGSIVISNNGFANVYDYAQAFVNVGIGYLRFVVDSNGNPLYTGNSDEDCVNWISQHGKTIKWTVSPIFVTN